jgi:pimeloyl-ACP methyl ester carboxylesterase
VAEAAADLLRLQTRSGALECCVTGEGSPTLLLFNGAGETLACWNSLRPGIEALGTVFAWNRFGANGSDEPRRDLTGTVVIGSLRELLQYSGLKPPYVLVAHSLGGLYAQLFARLHPAEVAGAMLIEAAHPRDDNAHEGHEDRFARALARVQSLPQEEFRPNLEAELAACGTLAKEIAAAGPFPDVPLTVVTGGLEPHHSLIDPETFRLRRENQSRLARLSPQGRQILAARSGHFPHVTQPAFVLEALRLLTISRG